MIEHMRHMGNSGKFALIAAVAATTHSSYFPVRKSSPKSAGSAARTTPTALKLSRHARKQCTAERRNRVENPSQLERKRERLANGEAEYNTALRCPCIGQALHVTLLTTGLIRSRPCGLRGVRKHFPMVTQQQVRCQLYDLWAKGTSLSVPFRPLAHVAAICHKSDADSSGITPTITSGLIETTKAQ